MKMKVGILGAGQLSCLIIKSLRKYDCEILVFANRINEPACALADKVSVGISKDIEALRTFFLNCDKVLLESEFFESVTLKKIEGETHTKVYPDLNEYSKLETKISQKKFFQDFGIPYVKSSIYENEEDVQISSYPKMLKKSYGSYDGHGNFLIENEKDFEKAKAEFFNKKSSGIIIEDYVEIESEFACMLVCGKSNKVILPPVQTLQENNVCQIVNYPAELNNRDEKELLAIMEQLSESIEGVGIYTFEFFKTKDGKILVNEAAPRVHNSYHLSIEAFEKSQFDLFVEAVLGIEIKPIERIVTNASMLNIIGQSNKENYQFCFPNQEIEDGIEFKIHLYGKKEVKIGRKMGHITFFGSKKTKNISEKVKSEYRI